MEWLNYHHLYYFWQVARMGSIAKATAVLKLSQPTISSQLKQLQLSLGEELFERQGRGLVLTESGKVVYEYASSIFAVARELQQSRKHSLHLPSARLFVGLPDDLPKLIAYRILQPVLKMAESVRLVCIEASAEKLIAELSSHALDVIISDAPLTQAMHVRAYNHFLGASGITFFGAPKLIRTLKGRFPKRLNGAPCLLPMENTPMRRSLDQWFTARGIAVRIVGEFQDSALLKTFGQAGEGIFAAPSVISAEVCKHYAVEIVGATDEIAERFYAISVERKVRHPAILRITESAREKLFV